MKPSSAELEGKTCSVTSQIVSKLSCFIKSSIDVMICPMSCPATHTQENLQLVAASCSYWCPRRSGPSATCTGGAFSSHQLAPIHNFHSWWSSSATCTGGAFSIQTSPFTYYCTNTLVRFATCTAWWWYVCIHVCVCERVCVCVCACVCVNSYTIHYTYIHTYIHTCIRTYVHTYTHTHCT